MRECKATKSINGVWNHVYVLEISKEELSYSQQQKPLTDSHGKIGKDERFTKWNICTRVLDVVSFVLFFHAFVIITINDDSTIVDDKSDNFPAYSDHLKNLVIDQSDNNAIVIDQSNNLSMVIDQSNNLSMVIDQSKNDAISDHVSE